MSVSRVAILMGSDSDWPVMKKAAIALADLGVGYEAHVMSAHRTPDDVSDFVREAPGRGVDVFIAGAGMAAHLAGVVAAFTTRPVIAVPIAAKHLDGLDALLAMVQMPPGVPVATVAVDGAKNAAILAVQMLAIGDKGLSDALVEHKHQMAEAVRAKRVSLD
jgi:5-(carboxyamino)imidazole ribonucleotide mutase